MDTKMLLRGGKHVVCVHQTACVKYVGVLYTLRKTDDAGTLPGHKVNPTCESVVKKVPARADPARGEHA